MASAVFRFVYNPECEVIMRYTPLLEPGLDEIIQSKLELAKAIAPVDTGAYRDSIEADVDFGGPGGEIRGVMFSDIRYAPYLEFGTSDTPTFATLRRALYGGTG
jgi:hypothetical protein